jgi:hypothetical protein
MSRSDPPRKRNSPGGIPLKSLCISWEEATPSQRHRLLRVAVAESRDAVARERITESPPNDNAWEEMTIPDRVLLVLSGAESARDFLAEALAKAQWQLEQLRWAAGTYERPAHQVARDAFILESYKEGKKLSVIRSLIRSRSDWSPLGTDSAVRHAMRRHCKRLGIKSPTRK